MSLDMTEAENWVKNLFNNFTVDKKYLDEDCSNEYLDHRDSDPFDSKWTSADTWLEKQAKENFSETEIELMEAMKEKWRVKFFEKIIKTTHSADLAAYLSEDIELVLGSKMMNAKNEFAEEISNALENGRLPE